MSLLLVDRIRYLKAVLSDRFIPSEMWYTLMDDHLNEIFSRLKIYFKYDKGTGEYYHCFCDDVFLFTLHHFHDDGNGNFSFNAANYFCWSLDYGQIILNNTKRLGTIFGVDSYKNKLSSRVCLEFNISKIDNFHSIEYYDPIYLDERLFEKRILTELPLITNEKVKELIKKNTITKYK